RFTHRVALHLEVDPHDFPHLRVVVDQQHERAARGLAGSRPVEERLEVDALIAPMAARRVEGWDAAEVGPLADRALGYAEELRRLAEVQPLALAAGGPPRIRRHPLESTQTCRFFTPDPIIKALLLTQGCRSSARAASAGG